MTVWLCNLQNHFIDFQEYIEPEDVFDINPKAEPVGLEGAGGDPSDTDIDVLTIDPVSFAEQGSWAQGVQSAILFSTL